MLVVSCLANNIFNSEMKVVPISIKSFIMNSNNTNAKRLLEDLVKLNGSYTEERLSKFNKSILDYQQEADKDFLISSILDMFPYPSVLTVNDSIIDILNYINRGRKVW